MMQKIIIGLFLLMSNYILSQKTLEWKTFHPIDKKWIKAGTHQSVQEVLLNNKNLPDSYYEKNELLYSWIEDHIWEFESIFHLSKEEINHEQVILNLPSVDTYAEIYLNDSLILFAQNAFLPYRLNIKNLSRIGQNILRIKFYPPKVYHKEAFLKAPYKLPAPNDLDSIAIAPYTRKPQYQFGWDWALRMNTIGLHKPVTIDCFNGVKIINKNIVIDDIQELEARVSMELMLEGQNNGVLKWESNLFGNVVFQANEKIIRHESIKNPLLWWPRGHGNANLYHDHWKLYNEKGQLLDSITVHFGIRKTELVQEKDQWGTSYVIKINNRTIFCKGADYIPQSMFPSKVKNQDIIDLVKTMHASNFNMVRVWGGGYYPDEVFYNTCDELGIMVWQDFMFACAMYPGDPDYLQNVKDEVSFHIPRISSHPSLALFNGNNEVDVAWKYWGFQNKYKFDQKANTEIENAYQRLFKQLLPTMVSTYSNTPYIHTSPLSHWGEDEFYNHGSQHYWGIWHGKDPMSDFAKKIGRFNAEYGFQSFPEFATLSSFSQKKDWDLNSEVMKHHQKSYVGNGMILKHAQLLYGEPKNFEQFVYYSQLTQAHAVSSAICGHRLDFPRCSGTLYWQLNDCWPAPTWSSIDYYGHWKALHYQVRDDFEDVAVLSKETEKGEHNYFLVSDQIDSFYCELTFKVYDLDGKFLFENIASRNINGYQIDKICFPTDNIDWKNLNYYIQFDWKDAKGNPKTRTFSKTPLPYSKSTINDIQAELMILNEKTNTYILKIKNDKFIKNFWVFADIIGLKYDRNFIDLIPGTHQIIINSPQKLNISELHWMWM